MNLRHLTFAAFMMMTSVIFAGNTRTTVTQVSNSAVVTGSVDYVITGETPFTTSGSINIKDTEHAVVIIQKVKPSKVIKNWLSHIYINGQPAVAGDLTSSNATAGSNCQVKMYNRGAIIMPYDQKFKPLTTFTEADFKGESCNNYTEGHSEGYMKTLTNATLNNNFKSFKLKRGYMVTFALGTGGWGYSRCFIADAEDLEMNLPINMSGRVSSYRLFKWFDASKAGIHDTSAEVNDALNTTSCFDWAQGNSSLLPDVEWVPNHIYEDWPSSATCGSVTGSCHMKTNNEPGNSSDDHPQTVDQVLNNWQNLMRTGMRLCSESSHDGSMSHLKSFIDSIDARGWRCDILDIHSYWTGQFYNFDWYRSEYGHGRPIWISEWVYGSSWGNAGIFNDPPSGRDSFSKENQQKNYEYVKPILDNVLNSKDYIERYFYWNSEADCSKIYKNGQNSILGQYYAKMETGLAYNRKNEFVPKVVYNKPKSFGCSYNRNTKICNFTWTDANGDMVDSVRIEVKAPGSNVFKALKTVTPKDVSNASGASYSEQVKIEEPGAYVFRVAAYSIGIKTAHYSKEAAISITSSSGVSGLQFGKISVTSLNALTTDFNSAFNDVPVVLMGAVSGKNTKLYPTNKITGVSTGQFSYTFLPWVQQSGCETTVSSPEEIPFMALESGKTYTFGDMTAVTGVFKSKTEDTEVLFDTPFPEGVKPIVLTDIRANSSSKAINLHVWDVTNTGFKCTSTYEEGENANIRIAREVSYIAITPGFAAIDEDNKLFISAGTFDIYGNIARTLEPKVGDTSLKFNEPLFFARTQTENYPASNIIRKISESSTDGMVTSFRVKRVVDATSTTTANNDSSNPDQLGWVVISTAAEGASVPATAIIDVNDDADVDISVDNGVISVDGISDYEIYNISGVRMDSKGSLTPGIYFVRYSNKSVKVVVK